MSRSDRYRGRDTLRTTRILRVIYPVSKNHFQRRRIKRKAKNFLKNSYFFEFHGATVLLKNIVRLSRSEYPTMATSDLIPSRHGITILFYAASASRRNREVRPPSIRLSIPGHFVGEHPASRVYDETRVPVNYNAVPYRSHLVIHIGPRTTWTSGNLSETRVTRNTAREPFYRRNRDSKGPPCIYKVDLKEPEAERRTRVPRTCIVSFFQV